LDWFFGYYTYRSDKKCKSIGRCTGLANSGSGNSTYYNAVDPKNKSMEDPNYKAYENPYYRTLWSPAICLNWKFVATNKEHLVRNVILHEIAHAIHYIRYNINKSCDIPHGHTKEFRQICKDLGLRKKSYTCTQSYKGVYSWSGKWDNPRVESKFERYLGSKPRIKNGKRYWDRSESKGNHLYDQNWTAGVKWKYLPGQMVMSQHYDYMLEPYLFNDRYNPNKITSMYRSDAFTEKEWDKGMLILG
jgi:hypothetical protein